MPFLFIASMIRMIDAVKSFDITSRLPKAGPGSASETINLYLYSVAFVYYDVGLRLGRLWCLLRSHRRWRGGCFACVKDALDDAGGVHEPAATIAWPDFGLGFRADVIVSPGRLFFL